MSDRRSARASGQAKASSVPKLWVQNDHVRNGTELRGTVDFGDAPNAALLLIDREGACMTSDDT